LRAGVASLEPLVGCYLSLTESTENSAALLVKTVGLSCYFVPVCVMSCEELDYGSMPGVQLGVESRRTSLFGICEAGRPP
jgi:hypothetical protein